MIRDPILITGLPRSGTSFVASVFHACGMWVGRCLGPTDDNPRGFYENRAMSGLLESFREGLAPTPDAMAGDMRLAAIGQGAGDGRPWGFKEPALLDWWPTLEQAFPAATWVACVREPGTAMASFARCTFGRKWRLDDLSARYAYLERRLGLLLARPGVRTVSVDSVAAGDWLALREAVEAASLPWVPERAVGRWDPAIWHQ